MNAGKQLLERLRTEGGVLVTVESTQGSVPRDAGTWMAVFHGDTISTIGGGKLEFDAIAQAREILHGTLLCGRRTLRLGPSLGQCCGGVVVLQFEAISAADSSALQARLVAAHVPVALFGAGHVGLALVRILATLPMNVLWLDSREAVFALDLPDTVLCEHSDPVHSAVATLQPQSRVVIMSFSHAEDLDVVAACLRRQRARADLPYVGLIGSKTKWATFRTKLLARGFTEAELAGVTCPIGISGIADKRPEAIAVAVAAQLLQVT